MKSIVTALALAGVLSTGALAADCADESTPVRVRMLQADIQKHLASIKQRQDLLADLQAKRAALLAAMRTSQTPAERAQKQALLEDITAKMNAVLASINPEQAAVDADNTQIAQLRTLPPCPRR